MGNKRFKLAKGLGNFIPISVNFSELERSFSDDNTKFDPSDNCFNSKRIEDNMEYEEMIIQILYNLEERDKLVFVFQLLRDNGFKIDHGSFAKALKLSRRQYMRILKDLRLKSKLFIIGYQQNNKFK